MKYCFNMISTGDWLLGIVPVIILFMLLLAGLGICVHYVFLLRQQKKLVKQVASLKSVPAALTIDSTSTIPGVYLPPDSQAVDIQPRSCYNSAYSLDSDSSDEEQREKTTGHGWLSMDKYPNEYVADEILGDLPDLSSTC